VSGTAKRRLPDLVTGQSIDCRLEEGIQSVPAAQLIALQATSF
jgi:uncharacterized membrane protein